MGNGMCDMLLKLRSHMLKWLYPFMVKYCVYYYMYGYVRYYVLSLYKLLMYRKGELDNKISLHPIKH